MTTNRPLHPMAGSKDPQEEKNHGEEIYHVFPISPAEKIHNELRLLLDQSWAHFVKASTRTETI